MWGIPQVMKMIRNGFYVCIGVGVEMGTRLTVIACARNNMERMGNHAGFHKRFAPVIKIQPPGIACSLSHYIELMLGGMITPYTCINPNPVFHLCAGFSNLGMGEHAMATP